MKLGEIVYWEKVLYEVIEFIGDTAQKHGNKPVRVEIHSLDPETWPTERPEGWGKGCWFEANVWQHGGSAKRTMILLSSAPFDDNKFHYRGFDPILGCETSVTEESITSFGPRVEVPE